LGVVAAFGLLLVEVHQQVEVEAVVELNRGKVSLPQFPGWCSEAEFFQQINRGLHVG